MTNNIKTKFCQELPNRRGKKDDFLPVLYQSEKTEFPISAIKDTKIVSSEHVARENLEYVVLTKEEGHQEETYLVTPRAFERALSVKALPENAQVLRKEVLEKLQTLKQAWVHFGTAVVCVHTANLFKAWGYENFQEYCERELKLHKTTVYEIMRSTLFLMQEKPEFYKLLVDGKQEVYASVPSYRCLFLLARYKHKLEQKGKFQECLKLLFDEKLATKELEAKLHEMLRKDKLLDKLSSQKVCRKFESIVDLMKKARVPREIWAEAFVVLQKWKKLQTQ